MLSNRGSISSPWTCLLVLSVFPLRFRLELHLAGGFLDSRGESERLSKDILGEAVRGITF